MRAATVTHVTAPPIPDTCVGGTRVSGGDCVECLGPVFRCEYFTAIERKGFCHHPRALEIAEHMAVFMANQQATAPRRVPTDVGRRLGKT